MDAKDKTAAVQAKGELAAKGRAQTVAPPSFNKCSPVTGKGAEPLHSLRPNNLIART